MQTGHELTEVVVPGIVSGNLLFDGDGNIYRYVYSTSPRVGSSYTRSGDSGAPVYTEPNSRDEVDIVGILVGETDHPLSKDAVDLFSSWDDIESMLDLEDI